VLDVALRMISMLACLDVLVVVEGIRHDNQQYPVGPSASCNLQILLVEALAANFCSLIAEVEMIPASVCHHLPTSAASARESTPCWPSDGHW